MEFWRTAPIWIVASGGRLFQGTTNNLWYSYDNLGNRQQQILNGTTTNYSYSYFANNELTSSATYSASALSASYTYTYDRNGNLATKSVTTSGTITWAHTWDAANHLLKVSSNGVTQGAYAYDGRGRQVEGIESSSTTFYAYLGTEVLFRNVYNQFGVDYLYAGGMRIATVDSSSGSYNTVKYFHEDALGSTRLVTSSSGVVTFADSYQPFGQDNGTPTGSETFKFTGKPFSQTTGLYYYYHRWYDPSIGRFLSPDPLAGLLSNPESLNQYLYASDSPVTLNDPTGLGPVLAQTRGSCPGIFQDFWGSLRCAFFGPAAVAGLTGGGAGGGLGGAAGGGPGLGAVDPTPAAALIAAIAWAYWLYVNRDNIWGSSSRVEPAVNPPPPGGSVPTRVPTPPDPTLKLPVRQPSEWAPASLAGGPVNTGHPGLGQGTGWTVGFSNGYARNLGKALRSPTVFKVCVGLTGAIALGLWTYETEETARQNINRDPSEYGDIWWSSALLCYGAAAAVYSVAGSF